MCFKRGPACRCGRAAQVSKKGSKNVVREQPLPPQIPETLAEIERAIMLLGSRWRCELTNKARNELEGLIGRYPSVKEAALWKSALKGLREDMLELGD